MPQTQAFEPKSVYREQKTVIWGLVPSATQVFAPKRVCRELRQAEMPFARYE